MTKWKKAIKGLECCMKNGVGCYEPSTGECPYYKDNINTSACIDDLCYDAYTLLKAQEPVKPKAIKFIDKGVTWEEYEVSVCGECGAMLGDALFCPRCGRAVKWDEEYNTYEEIK